MRRFTSGRLLPAALLAGLFVASGASDALAQGAPIGEEELSADEKKERAKAAFTSAQEKYAAGDYAGAAAQYKEADKYVPGEVPKYMMAESLDKAGNVPEAVAAYQAFIDSKPREKYQDKVDAAKQRIEELKKMPALVTIAVTPEVQNPTVVLDGEPQTGLELEMPPGHHSVTVEAEGYKPSTQEFDVTFGEKTQLNITLEEDAATTPVAPPPVTPVTEEPEEERSLVPAYITLGLAGAGAVVGTIFGIMALGSKSDFEDNPTQDSFDETERNALISDMSFGVALTFGVTGVVLLLSGDDEPTTGKREAPASATLTPYAGPNGGGAVGTFRF